MAKQTLHHHIGVQGQSAQQALQQALRRWHGSHRTAPQEKDTASLCAESSALRTQEGWGGGGGFALGWTRRHEAWLWSYTDPAGQN